MQYTPTAITIKHYALLATVFWATCSSSTSAATTTEDVNTTVHLFVYETDEAFVKENPLLQSQQTSIPGLRVENVGIGDTFTGFGSKYTAVMPRLQSLPENDLVIVSDGRDVLLNHYHSTVAEDDEAPTLTIQSFIDTFDTLIGDSSAVVFSAEAQCCVSALTYAAPGDYFNANDGSRTQRACFSGKGDCMWNGDEKAVPWETFMQERAQERNAESRDDIYLNAGLMVGRAKDLIRVISKADIGSEEDDQAVLTGYMYLHPDEIVLDYDQALFGNNRDTCMFELYERHLVHKQTKTTPLLIHTPGGTATCHEELMNELGQTKMSRTIRRRLSQWNTGTHNYKECPAGSKLVSGYCVKEWCHADYTCPRNSVRKPNRQCYNNCDDCQCKAGYYMSRRGYCQRNYWW